LGRPLLYPTNQRILKRRINIDNVNISAIDTDYNFVFLADVGDSNGYKSDTLESTISPLQQLTNSLVYVDKSGNNSKTSIMVRGFDLRFTIQNVAPIVSYVRMVLCRDKYRIFPGFTDNFSATIATAAGEDSNNGTDFFRNMDEPTYTSSFKQVGNHVRTLQPMNPFRYTIIWDRTYKVAAGMNLDTAGNPTSVGTGQNFMSIHQYVPYKKELIYPPGDNMPSNDYVHLFVFTSTPPYNSVSNGDTLLQVKGDCKLRYLGDCYKS
jgi:hypothetical protein